MERPVHVLEEAVEMSSNDETETQAERITRLERAVAQLARLTTESPKKIAKNPDLARILDEHPVPPKRGHARAINPSDVLGP
jgi:hypothetical protein